MWTAENRARYDRSRLRYPSDLTDEEWALISPRIPPAQAWWHQTHGEPARDRQRADVHPKHGLPMASDSERPATALDLVRLLRSVELGRHARSHLECRERAGREASPTAAIIDSQSVKSAENGGLTIRMDMMRASRQSSG
jgi:transposase